MDPAWPSIPNNWVLGEVTSISVDSKDHIWVLHVPQSVPEAQRANAAPPVLEFDAAGKLLTSWGGPGDGYEWLGREHGIFVDANNFVWIGGRAGWPRATTPGNSDDMLLKFTAAGKFVMQIGHRGQSKGNIGHGKRAPATDVVRRYVGERGVRRRRLRQQARGGVRFGDGQVQAHVGRIRQHAAADAGAEPRRAAAADHARGTPGVRVAARDQSVEATGSSTSPIASTTAFSCSRRQGKFLKQVRVTNEGSTVVPVPAGFAFSPDRKQQYLYVVDSGPMRVVIFDRATMTQIGVIGMRGKNAGDFDIVHHMAADSKGNLYTAEIVNNHRAQRFVLQRAR